MTPEQQSETIGRIQNVPSGEIFKGIGAVLAAHADRLETLERKNISDRWREICAKHPCRYPPPPPEAIAPGKFRKLCSACARIYNWWANILRKK